MNPLIIAGMALAFTVFGCARTERKEAAAQPAPASVVVPEGTSPMRSERRFGEGCEFPLLDVMAAEEDQFIVDVFVLGAGAHRIAHPCWDRLSKEEREDLGYDPENRPSHLAQEGMRCSLLFAPDAATLRVLAERPPQDGFSYARIQGYAHPWMEDGTCLQGLRREAAVELSMPFWCPTGAVLLVDDDMLRASSDADEAGRHAVRDVRDAIRRNADHMTDRRKRTRESK